MRFFVVFFVSLFVSCFGGCATLPEVREDALEVADLVRNIKCELRDAAWIPDENAWIRDWNAGLTVSLIVDHLGGVTADGAWTIPLSQGGNFILGFTAGATGSANRTERLDFKENLTKLNADRDLMCFEQSESRFARLEGKLGIEEVFRRAKKTIEVARIGLKQLDYNIDFIIKKEGTLNPKWALIPVGSNKNFSGGVKWTGSRTDTHTLKMVLQPPSPPCNVKDEFGNCASPVYNVRPLILSGTPNGTSGGNDTSWNMNYSVDPTASPGIRQSGDVATPARRRRVPAKRTVDGITSEDARRLESGQTRNLLQSLDDQLRRDGIQ